MSSGFISVLGITRAAPALPRSGGQTETATGRLSPKGVLSTRGSTAGTSSACILTLAAGALGAWAKTAAAGTDDASIIMIVVLVRVFIVYSFLGKFKNQRLKCKIEEVIRLWRIP
jgi:hypothetical protein